MTQQESIKDRIRRTFTTTGFNYVHTSAESLERFIASELNNLASEIIAHKEKEDWTDDFNVGFNFAATLIRERAESLK